MLADVEVSIDFLRPALKTPPGIFNAAIPPEYIENERLRISAYRRIAEIRSEYALEEFKEELRDRYGRLPECTENLLTLNLLRILCALNNIHKLTVVNGTVSLHLPGAKIYRDHTGKLPRLDSRDPFRLRIRRLIDFCRKARG